MFCNSCPGLSFLPVFPPHFVYFNSRSPHQMACLAAASVSHRHCPIVHCCIPFHVHRMVISLPSLSHPSFSDSSTSTALAMSLFFPPTHIHLHPLSPRVPTHLSCWHPLLLPFQLPKKAPLSANIQKYDHNYGWCP
jgi:hypothetical protein